MALLIIKYWQQIALGFVILGALLWLNHYFHENENLKKQIEGDHEVITLLNNNNSRLQSSLTEQNAAIDAMKSAADKRAAESATALSTAHRLAIDANKRADTIMKSQPSADKCASANLLINEVLK
jgi:hypothetical protein